MCGTCRRCRRCVRAPVCRPLHPPAHPPTRPSAHPPIHPFAVPELNESSNATSCQGPDRRGGASSWLSALLGDSLTLPTRSPLPTPSTRTHARTHAHTPASLARIPSSRGHRISLPCEMENYYPTPDGTPLHFCSFPIIMHEPCTGLYSSRLFLCARVRATTTIDAR
jgi:hypothetical protein